MAFTNKFLSLAGQKERLKNVIAVGAIALNPFSKDKIVASTSSPTVNAVLEAGVNNPYSTAGLVYGLKTGAVSKGVSSLVSSLKPTTKVVASAGAVLAGGTLIGSERARVATAKTIGALAPEQLLKGGKELGSVIDKPTLQGAIDFAKENPILAGGGAVLATVVAGKTILPTVRNVVQTESLLDIAKESEAQTALLEELTKKGQENTLQPSDAVIATTPIKEGSPNNPIVNPTVGEEPKRKRRKIKPKPVKVPRKMPKYRKIYKEEVFSYPHVQCRRC